MNGHIDRHLMATDGEGNELHYPCQYFTTDLFALFRAFAVTLVAIYALNCRARHAEAYPPGSIEQKLPKRIQLWTDRYFLGLAVYGIHYSITLIVPMCIWGKTCSPAGLRFGWFSFITWSFNNYSMLMLCALRLQLTILKVTKWSFCAIGERIATYGMFSVLFGVISIQLLAMFGFDCDKYRNREDKIFWFIYTFCIILVVFVFFCLQICFSCKFIGAIAKASKDAKKVGGKTDAYDNLITKSSKLCLVSTGTSSLIFIVLMISPGVMSAAAGILDSYVNCYCVSLMRNVDKTKGKGAEKAGETEISAGGGSHVGSDGDESSHTSTIE